MNYVKSFDLFGVPAAQIPATPGSGAPTIATEGAVGCLYMDTDTGNLYKCTGVADGTYTWVEAGNGGSDQTAGLGDTAASLLITILRNGIYSTDQSANITALEVELASAEEPGDNPGGEEEPDDPVTPEKTLSSISAVYSGGDVPVDTAVTDLTGIVVTAYYSNGSTATVTGYTLSGEIAEGSNTITVSYGGKTTTFTVTGVVEESEPVVVAMTMPNDNCGISWANSSCYSDGGNTAFAGKGSANGNIWVSDVFEQDTVVNVTVLYGITNAALAQYCGCLSADTVLSGGGSNAVSVYYMEKIGTASTDEYTAQYTVRAGYRLAFINYNSGRPQSFVVTK